MLPLLPLTAAYQFYLGEEQNRNTQLNMQQIYTRHCVGNFTGIIAHNLDYNSVRLSYHLHSLDEETKAQRI